MAERFDHFSSPTTAINAGTARASTPESAAHVNSTTLSYEYKALLSRRLFLHQSQEMALLGGQLISTAKAAEILSLPASKEGWNRLAVAKQERPREKWDWIIPLIGIFIGLSLVALLIYNGLTAVINHEYCSILDENFSRGFNINVWTKEVEFGGFEFVHVWWLTSSFQQWSNRWNNHKRRKCLRPQWKTAHQTKPPRGLPDRKK